MTILLKEVEEVAKLAKLKFNDAEKQKLQNELDNIIIYMDKINEIDMNEIKPIENLSESLENVLDEDIKSLGLSDEETLKIAPKRKDDLFWVPNAVNE